MKHGLPLSPISIITNFLSNVDFFGRYRNKKIDVYNILGVSGTLGTVDERKFIRETFLVESATIPTSRRRKLFEIDGVIPTEGWLSVITEKVVSTITQQRAVLVICEDIATAEIIHNRISTQYKDESNLTIYVQTGYDEGRLNNVLKPGDVVITTNLGARGTDYVTDKIVNKNGGLFVLVSFIPLNDRAEMQAFGRTGRRGATGSCQIIPSAMPKWLESCESVKEMKNLRNHLEMHRLVENIAEVNMALQKSELFREYCEYKKEFKNSSECDYDDLKVQIELLDEIWAKWIQDCGIKDPYSNYDNAKEELRKRIEDCSKQAKRFKSDNIYHFLKFGGVRLEKGDFRGASECYDQAIRMDPAWSAFAHYNRAYCTIQLKDDGYIKRAIDDLEAALCKLIKYKSKSLFSEIFIHWSVVKSKLDKNDLKLKLSSDSSRYSIWMECQLFHHIETQIIKCIKTLKTIDPMKGEVKTERQNILYLIPGADCTTMNLFQEYSQFGLLFTYNIDEKPKFCYMNLIVYALVFLESVTVSIFEAFVKGKLVSYFSPEVKDMIDAVCNIEWIVDGSLAWMSQCVSEAINVGIQSIVFSRDIGSLIPVKNTELKSGSEITAESAEFTHFARLQAKSVLISIQERRNSIIFQNQGKLLLRNDFGLNSLRTKISLAIQKPIVPGNNVCRDLSSLYSNVESQYRFNLQRIVATLPDLAQVQSSNAKIIAGELHQCARVLRGIPPLLNSLFITNQITDAAAKTENIITIFSDMFFDKITQFQNGKTDVYNYSFDDTEMLEAVNNVLTSAWSDFICVIVESEMSRLFLNDLQRDAYSEYPSKIDNHRLMIKYRETFIPGMVSETSTFAKIHATRKLSPRLKIFYRDQKASRGPKMCSMTEATLASRFWKCSIIISDVDNESILVIPYHGNDETREFIYDASSLSFPARYNLLDVVVVVDDDNDDDNLFHAAFRSAHKAYSKLNINAYIDKRPRQCGKLFATEQ